MKRYLLVTETNLFFRCAMWLITGAFLLAGSSTASAQNSGAGDYYLIAGSFHSFESANEALEEFEDQGFQPIILFPAADGKDLYRVSIYQAAKRTEVVQYQALLKGQGRKGGWIYQAKASTASQVNSRMASIPGDATERHYLIVSSLKGYTDALDAAAVLNEKGYETEVLFPGQGSEYYRISVYQATDREEIEAYSAMLKKQGKEAGWVYSEPIISGASVRAVPTAAITRSGAAAEKGLRFHLIVGSYDNYMMALDYADQLKTKGYDALVIFPDKPTGNYRVSLYHSNDRAEVAGFGQNQKKQKKLTGWVLDRGE